MVDCEAMMLSRTPAECQAECAAMTKTTSVMTWASASELIESRSMDHTVVFPDPAPPHTASSELWFRSASNMLIAAVTSG